MISNFIKALIVSIIFLTGLEFFVYDFHLIYSVLPIVIFLTFLISIIPFKSRNSYKDRFYNFIIISLLEFGGFLFLSILQKEFLRHYFMIAASIGLLVLYLMITTYKSKYYSIFNSSIYFIFFTLFYSILGLRIYLNNFSNWHIIIAIFVVSFLLLKQIFWYNNYTDIRSWFYSIVIALILAEIFWTLTLWPIRYLVNAITLLIVFYVFSEIILNYYKNSLTRRVVFEYILFGAFILVIVFSTTKWIPGV